MNRPRTFMSHKELFMHRTWLRMVYVLSTMLLLFLAACGGPPATSTTGSTGTPASAPGVIDKSKQYSLDFWEAFSTGANKAVLQTLTQQYMKAHPNVKINLQAYDSYTTLQTKLTAAIAAGKPPALAQVYENWASQYQQSDAIESLQSYISGKNGLSQQDMADFYPSLLKDGQINGTQYMLPFNKSDEVVYYNADALQKYNLKPPTTIQEFVSDLTKVTKADGSQWGLSFTPSIDEWSILYKALGGTDFVAKDGKSTSFDQGQNKVAATTALATLEPLVKAGAVHVTQQYAWQNDFIAQKAVFTVATIASYPFLASGIKGAFKFDEAPIPAGPAGQYTVLFGTNLSIFSGVDADTKSAAWDFMKFLTSADANATFVQGTGYMPIRQSVFNSATLQGYYSKVPARKVGPQLINNAFVASIVPAWQSCRDIITNDYTSVLKGQLTPDAGLTKMSQDCNAKLAQG